VFSDRYSVVGNSVKTDDFRLAVSSIARGAARREATSFLPAHSTANEIGESCDAFLDVLP
jgi:hypothetical protein